MSRIISRIVALLPPTTLKRIGEWQFSSPLARRVIRWGSRWIRNQDATIKYGVGAGLMFNTQNANPGYALGTTEPLIQEVLAQCLRPGDAFYDIGANVGFFTVIAARLVQPSGRVYAFDPLPCNITALRHNMKLNGFSNVTVFEKAVAATTGEAELSLAPETTWAKLASTGVRADARGSLSVGTVSLDDVIAQQGLAAPTFLKIDVEGAELDVLRGMRQVLAKDRPLILCEAHGTNESLSEMLEEAGYWQHVIEEPGKTLTEAHWSAHVLAGPPSRKEVLEAFQK